MMMSDQRWTWARFVALAAGAMDFATGLGLVAVPAITLKLMLVPVPEASALVFVRFVGVFVAAVGATYLLALRRGDEAVAAVFRFTVPFRLGAGTFCAVAVSVGALAPMWLSVTVADYALVALQVAWLRTGCREANA